MLDFRKALFAVAVAGLGLVGSASAQNVQGTLVVTPGFAPLESTTAQLPATTVNIAPTTMGGTNPTSLTFTLTASVPFTNMTTSSGLDALAVGVDSSGNPVGQPAVATQPNPTVLQFVFGSFSASAVGIKVTNLRANASVVGASSTITLTLAGVPGGGLTTGMTGTTAIAAYVVRSISSVAFASPGAPNLASCNVTSTQVAPVATLNMTEGFPGALIVGTRVAVTFSNLNAGVNYYVPSSVSTASGLLLQAFGSATGGSALTVVTSPAAAASAGLVLLTSTGGSATVWYQVITNASSTPNSFSVPLSLSIPNLANVTSYNTMPVAASVALVGPATGYPQYSPNITYPATQSGTTNVGLLSACSTTMLFTYVVNTQGFDTGLVIANASNLLSTNGAAGSCTFSFYGTHAPSTGGNTGNIAVGQSYINLLSALAPGFQGFMVATCNFQGSHGYAFLSSINSAANYLAPLVVAGGSGNPDF